MSEFAREINKSIFSKAVQCPGGRSLRYVERPWKTVDPVIPKQNEKVIYFEDIPINILEGSKTKSPVSMIMLSIIPSKDDKMSDNELLASVKEDAYLCPAIEAARTGDWSKTHSIILLRNSPSSFLQPLGNAFILITGHSHPYWCVLKMDRGFPEVRISTMSTLIPNIPQFLSSLFVEKLSQGGREG
ncbi:unnamed protein product [Lepeophtheirus salmonis]|uniref:(salmon louse) hypothetical protein n=1 Tax=Lepeophtheirus salmonis TaxID=72036 RepID=A0A7R8H9V9_LEPSM|nr:unnamed protein product [Lepeophtheirus salmonis]CAF2961583.1 unnamed protein product [Lepeophtheirus salmonis]